MSRVTVLGLLLVGCGTVQHPKPITLVPSTMPLMPDRYEVLQGGQKTVVLCGQKRSMAEGLSALRAAVPGADAFIEFTIEDVDVDQYILWYSNSTHCLRLTGRGVRLLDRPATSQPPAEDPIARSPTAEYLFPTRATCAEITEMLCTCHTPDMLARDNYCAYARKFNSKTTGTDEELLCQDTVKKLFPFAKCSP